MVCEKCQKKLGRVVVPDVWKDGARNTKESGGQKISENKLLSSQHYKFTTSVKEVPIAKKSSKVILSSGDISKTRVVALYADKCKICKSALHQPGYYCQGCSYAKGICSMCGKKILDTSMYRQTSV